jgi:catechol 2,3-dioxygenase-like lactoylglutathione lyase family enzyme
MDWKIELIGVPVSDVDRSIAFYRDQAGFVLDHDNRVSEDIRFVQLTPPGSACSIAFGEGISDMAPGSLRGIQVVVADAAQARAELVGRGVEATEVDEQPWGKFVYFADPDGNAWALQELPDRG